MDAYFITSDSNVDVDCYQHTEYFNPPLGYSGVIRSKSYDCVVKNFHFSVVGGDVYYVYDVCFEINFVVIWGLMF